MKRIIFILVLVGAIPLSLLAQDDDMYYVPGKSQQSEKADKPDESEQPTYYCGSDRDVDEYNRRGRVRSYYQKIGSDSLGNDIIEFHEGDGTYGSSGMNDTVYVYPGSEQYYDDSDFDYTYSRYLGRFDGFYGWYDPYFSFYWRGPYWWGYDYYWYDPLYYGYYSPWYWYGWHSPYYYGWHGWHGWRPSYYYSYSRPTGTTNHSTGSWHSSGRRTSGFPAIAALTATHQVLSETVITATGDRRATQTPDSDSAVSVAQTTPAQCRVRLHVRSLHRRR